MGERSDLSLNVSEMADRVCERLRNRRIGFLWSGASADPPPVPGFTWVHYTLGESGVRRYDARNLENPEREAATLSAIVVPGGTTALVAELFSGLACSKFARIISGCIDTGVPVLFETSTIADDYAAGSDSFKRNVKAAMECLSSKGVSFLGKGMEDRQQPKGDSGSATLKISDSSWHSWSEISEMLCERSYDKVILARSAKLTPEALDRLRLMNIDVLEVDV